MAKEPKIKVEDLPEGTPELEEKDLEAVTGGAGVKKIDALTWNMKTQLTRASDPDSGDPYT